MLVLDVNVLAYAHREDSPPHREIKAWMEHALAAEETIGLSDLVLSGFIRIVTHPKIWNPPTPLPLALDFVEALRSHPHVIILQPGARHWSIFTSLCRRAHAHGNLISDAYHAALCMEIGGEWVTTDRDFSRFPGLKWRHPLD